MPFNDDSSALTTAISLWRAGRRISMVLAQRLMAEGYDIPSLERAYSPKRMGTRQRSAV
jgi:hypothetical protein